MIHRLMPVAVVNLRTVDTDNYVLGGYRIPKEVRISEYKNTK